jgi:quercetin dioxygenase-like cupin family protein
MELHSWDTVKKEVLNEKLARKVISGQKIMLAQIFLSPGCVVPAHEHESEQVSYVLEGALKFELEGKEVLVHAGEALIIPSNVVHRVVALKDSLSLDIFSPIRTDWLTGQDDYLRR